MAKSNAKSAKKGGSAKSSQKGSVYTPPDASTELPLSFYESQKRKGKKPKDSEIPCY